MRTYFSTLMLTVWSYSFLQSVLSMIDSASCLIGYFPPVGSVLSLHKLYHLCLHLSILRPLVVGVVPGYLAFR